MRIATYNLWNSPARRDDRLAAAGEELSRLGASIVALQEVAIGSGGSNAARYLKDHCGFSYFETRPYPDDPGEGLAFLSNVPIHAAEAGWETGLPALRNCGLRACVRFGDTEIAITNVHLDYSNIAIREAQISQVLEWIGARAEAGCFEVLCGDFNCTPDSSVYRYLMGQQTILGQGVTHWHDLARVGAEREGRSAEATLDFWNNPRWHGSPTLEIPMRVDWLLFQDTFDRGLGYPRVADAGVFGVEPTPEAGVVPSDHYGVYATLTFDAEECHSS